MKQFFALLITLTLSTFVLAQSPADLVLVDGKIWTVNDKQAEVEAVAVLGNRIAAVGSTREVRKWIGANTKVIDLQGRRVTPGFNDSHVHFLDGGMGHTSGAAPIRRQRG
jgi:predicted amidohydrolase YtcJ